MGNTAAPRRCRASRNAFSRAETPTGSPPARDTEPVATARRRTSQPLQFRGVGAYDHPPAQRWSSEPARSGLRHSYTRHQATSWSTTDSRPCSRRVSTFARRWTILSRSAYFTADA